MIIGHEFAGIVVEVGEGVDPAWLGKLVASSGSIACGACEKCRGGRSNLCRSYATVGLHRDGALARYVSTPPESCIDVGSLGIGSHEAALVQPIGIAVHAARRSGVRAGDVAVGAFLIHVLRDIGASVVAVDIAPERLAVAEELGADVCILAGAAHTATRVAAQVTDRVPILFEASGSEAGLRLALEIAPMGTSIVLVDIQKLPSEVDFGSITVRELSLVGTNALVRETDLPEAARLVAVCRGRWSSIAPAPIPIADVVAGALRPMSEGQPPTIKTLIAPGHRGPGQVRVENSDERRSAHDSDRPACAKFTYGSACAMLHRGFPVLRTPSHNAMDNLGIRPRKAQATQRFSIYLNPQNRGAHEDVDNIETVTRQAITATQAGFAGVTLMWDDVGAPPSRPSPRSACRLPRTPTPLSRR